MEAINETKWILEKLNIEFKPGYSFNNTEDRYEGKIEFRNNKGDSFKFNLNEEQTQKYVDVIADDIIKSAKELGSKLSLSLKK